MSSIKNVYVTKGAIILFFPILKVNNMKIKIKSREEMFIAFISTEIKKRRHYWNILIYEYIQKYPSLYLLDILFSNIILTYKIPLIKFFYLFFSLSFLVIKWQLLHKITENIWQPVFHRFSKPRGYLPQRM